MALPTKGHPLPGTDPISTSVTRHNGVAVLAVSGEVDLSTAPAFEAAIAEALDPAPTALVVDLSGVDFLASAGLQTLVATQERVSKDTGDTKDTKPTAFAVVANGPATSRPIQLTGLDEILSLYPSMAEAMAALATLD
jgi:anti-anti-sigma factor